MNKTTYEKRLKQWNDILELINSYNLKDNSKLINNNFIQCNRDGILYFFTRPVKWDNRNSFTRINNFKYPREEKDITFNTFKKNLILELDNIKYHENLELKHKASI